MPPAAAPQRRRGLGSFLLGSTVGVVIAVLVVLLLVGACCAGLIYYGSTLPTPTPTPEPAPAPLFVDDFTNPGTGWQALSSDNAKSDYDQGQYLIQVNRDNWIAWSTPKQLFSNVHIEVTAQGISGQTDTVLGLMCGFQDDNNFYYAGIDSSGQYAIIHYSQGEHTYLTSSNELSASDQIQPDNDAYRLGVDCGNREIKLYADGALVDTVSAPDLGEGDVGLFVWTTNIPSGESRKIYFKDFVVMALP